jgi:hypothetical protein
MVYILIQNITMFWICAVVRGDSSYHCYTFTFSSLSFTHPVFTSFTDPMHSSLFVPPLRLWLICISFSPPISLPGSVSQLEGWPGTVCPHPQTQTWPHWLLQTAQGAVTLPTHIPAWLVRTSLVHTQPVSPLAHTNITQTARTIVHTRSLLWTFCNVYFWSFWFF